MKKTVKKLVLAKETVRNLDGVDLGRAAGGTAISLQLACPSQGEGPFPVPGVCLPSAVRTCIC